MSDVPMYTGRQPATRAATEPSRSQVQSQGFENPGPGPGSEEAEHGADRDTDLLKAASSLGLSSNLIPMLALTSDVHFDPDHGGHLLLSIGWGDQDAGRRCSVQNPGFLERARSSWQCRARGGCAPS